MYARVRVRLDGCHGRRDARQHKMEICADLVHSIAHAALARERAAGAQRGAVSRGVAGAHALLSLRFPSLQASRSTFVGCRQ